MDLGLKGKKAIVTGGTRGIGRAIVEELAREGCDIALCARGSASVDETVQSLSGRGVRAIGNAVDVADLAKLSSWIRDSASQLGGLDIFIANVSALGMAMDEDTWRRSIETDVMGTVFGVEAALPSLSQSTAGALVVVGTTGLVEVTGPPRPYASVKAALVPYVKALARMLAPSNVRANMVSPGTIYFEGGVWDTARQQNPEFYQAALARNPMGRMGRPEEVANAVVFLASPRAGFVSGTNLIVDGALTQRVQF